MFDFARDGWALVASEVRWKFVVELLLATIDVRGVF